MTDKTIQPREQAAHERALFEAWYQSLASLPSERSTGKWLDPSDGEIKPLQWPKEYFALVEKVIDGGEIVLEYEMDFMRRSWAAWQAGRASAIPVAAPEAPASEQQAKWKRSSTEDLQRAGHEWDREWLESLAAQVNRRGFHVSTAAVEVLVCLLATSAAKEGE